eukprot:5663794-Prymnesium_polylepis.1
MDLGEQKRASASRRRKKRARVWKQKRRAPRNGSERQLQRRLLGSLQGGFRLVADVVVEETVRVVGQGVVRG